MKQGGEIRRLSLIFRDFIITGTRIILDTSNTTRGIAWLGQDDGRGKLR